MKSEPKNELSWNEIFSDLDILNEILQKGNYVITSKHINKYRESRLMTKFDHEVNLPTIFKKNNLSILPVSRGSYVIAKFEAYQKVNYSKMEPIPMPKRADLESLDYNNIYSEASAINCAFLSGILFDLIGEDCELTVSGRMSSKSFDFNIKTKTVERFRKMEIKNSQCEIDAGFESKSKLIILEAKNEKCKDFLIRQIYYPYRLWKSKIKKQVIPVFMTFSNDVYTFFIYKFTDDSNYNSLKLIKQKSYTIESEPINIEDIKRILKTLTIEPEPEVPFPQADKFERVVDLLGLLMDKNLSKDDITSKYNFDERQTSYYTTAARYLGLIKKYKDKKNVLHFSLNESVRKKLLLPKKNKDLEFVKSILIHKPFNLTLKKYLENSQPPKIQDIVNVMKDSNLYQVDSDVTYRRRAQTVLKWTEWIIGLFDN
jgi:hypothetical protein